MALSVVSWLVPRRAAWFGAGLLGVVVALWLALAGGGGWMPEAAGGWGSLPVGARLAVSRGLGGVVGGFGVVRVGGVGLVARGGGVGSVFGVGGVRVSGGLLRLGLSGVGRGGVVRGVGGVAPVVVGGNRVRYVRGGLVEWYANGPLGLEQGFVLGRRPAGSGVLMLRVGVVGGGARGRVVGGGSGLVVSGRGGGLLRYGDLSVVDAVGRRVPVRVVLVGSRVWLRVDDVGVRYPLRVDPLVQQAELTANGTDELGASVAISGDTIVAGTKPVAGDHGAVYVFTMPASGWQDATPAAELTASDGASGDELGASVAIDGDTVVAGAPGHTVASNAGQGAAYVFTKPAGGWQNENQTAELTSAGGASGDALGSSVAVSGVTIAAGAPAPSSSAPGAVYEFTMPLSGGWQNATQTAKLTASDGAAGDELGESVGVDGATIVAGAPEHQFSGGSGTVYVYTMPPSGGWQNATQGAELTATGSGAFAGLGTSVAISSSTVVSGAPFAGSNGGGAAYVYTMPPSGGWQSAAQTAALTASDGGPDDALGTSVAISGDTIVAGANFHTVGSDTNQGAAYAFTMPPSGWTSETESSEMTARDGAAQDQLGASVGVSGDSVVAGAPDHEVGSNQFQGAAYEFGPGDTTSASTSCFPSPAVIGSQTSCTTTVTDTAAAGQTAPTGTVALTATPGGGSFSTSGSCTLEPTPATGVSSCAVAYVPATSGNYTITGTYTGDSHHAAASGSVAIAATPPPPPSAPLVAVPPQQTVTGPTAATFSGTVVPEGLAATAYFEYGLDPKYFGGGPVVYTEATPTKSIGSGFGAVPVSSSVTGLVPNALYHVRLVASNSAGTTLGPDQEFTTFRGAPPPAPVVGKTVNVAPVSGFALIRPGSGKGSSDRLTRPAAALGLRAFVPVTEARQIRAGSIVDAKKSVIKLTSATGERRKKLQSGTFGRAVFSVSQARSGANKGLTTITLRDGVLPGTPSPSICKQGHAANAAGSQPLAAAAASRKVLQLLKASDHGGKFRTSGRYSAATVLGTEWETIDRCDGTLTVVVRGRVEVRNFVTNQTVILHAGQRYLAAAPTTTRPAKVTLANASLPVGARLAVSRGLGGVVGGFGVVRVGGVGLVARGGGVGSVFGVGGVRVSGGLLRLGLSGVGRGGVVRGVGGVAPVVVGGNRVRYVRGGLVEWYANGPLGLEQGFVLGRRPAGSGVLMLRVGVVGGGARGRVVGGGSGLVVSGRGGGLLRYGDLSVVDAVGRRVPVRVVLVGSRVWLRVDDVGVRYPLRVDPLVQQAELTASDGDTDDQFGYSVAMSGDTLVVGAPSHDGEDGAVYVYTRPPSGWQDATQVAELTLSDEIATALGNSVAIDGDTIVAGAPYYVTMAGVIGAAVVYTMPLGGWRNETENAVLDASDGADQDQLGWSVAVSGNEIAAGAPGPPQGATAPGSVYEFTMPQSGWQGATQTAELTTTDGAAGDSVGQSVAISGGTIVAGAPDHQVAGNAQQGTAYVFAMPQGGWQDETQTGELTASDGAPGDSLGFSVATTGATVVAGAPGHEDTPQDFGKVYVFMMPTGGWQSGHESAGLTGAGGESTLLGWSVAMDGDTIVAGALLGRSDGQGAAFAYTMSPSGWQDATPVELTAADGVSQDQFGNSVALAGDTIVAGAPLHRVGANGHQGSAYVFGLEDPTSTMAACGSSPSVVGSPVTCTASVSDFASDGLGTPGGVVTFSSPASGGAFVGPGTCTLNAAASGVASCSVSFIPSAAGSWTIGAAYGGDSMHEGSSGTAPVTALDPTTAAAVCYPVAGQGGPTCTVTATITDVAGGSQRPPTGSVAFGAVPASGSFTNGAVCTLLPTSATSSSCQVSFGPSQTMSYQLTVSYGGDGFHQGSSAAFGITSFASTIARGPGRLAIAHGVRVSKSRVAGIALSCSGVAGASCAGKLTLTARVSRKVRRRVDGRWRVISRTAIVTLGSAKYALIAGRSKTLRVKLVAGSLGWIAVAGGHRLRTQATIAQDGAATLHVNLTLVS